MVAREELTRDAAIVNHANNDVVNSELTIVNWAESHFRTFLKALPYTNGNKNRVAFISVEYRQIWCN